MANEKNRIGKLSKSNKFSRLIWNITYTLLFRPAVTRLLWPWRWALLRMFGGKVSYKANVYSSVKIWAPWNLQMEKGSCLGPHVICYNQNIIRIEEDATVSQYAFLCSAGHDTREVNNAKSGLITAPITIKARAWIGAQAFVGMGVIVGNDAVVGARTAVFKDVEPNTIVITESNRVIMK